LRIETQLWEVGGNADEKRNPLEKGDGSRHGSAVGVSEFSLSVRGNN